MRRALLLVAALLMTLLATTACVGVPDTGPVVSADDQVRTQPEADVERRAQRPQEGQSAQEVVTAFLQAMTAYPVRTDVARQFLATDARAGWDPLRKVITRLFSRILASGESSAASKSWVADSFRTVASRCIVMSSPPLTVTFPKSE